MPTATATPVADRTPPSVPQGYSVTGKTHLLVGCCSLATAQGRRASYLSLASVRGHLRAASDSLDADLLALDDVGAVAGDRADEVALFDLHNRQRDAGRAIVYAHPQSSTVHRVHPWE